MTAQFGVQADPQAAEHGQLPAVIASLPLSLRRDTVDADLIAVDGSPGWTHRAITAGARGLVIVDPVAEPVDELIAHAAGRGVPIAVDSHWWQNPAVAEI